jgi:type VI secretion system protein ImpG
MEDKLLDYYNMELAYMREYASEFAQRHPGIASHLGMAAGEIADPHVERLIESFCFLSARTHIKLDAGLSNFSRQILDIVHPHFTAPTPAILIARLFPSASRGELRRGVVVPRGSELISGIPPGEQTACRFASSLPVTLWPIEITNVALTGAPPDIASPDRYLPRGLEVRGALRLGLRTLSGIAFRQLEGLDALAIHLCGGGRIASQLLELLVAGTAATVVVARDVGGGSPCVHTTDGQRPTLAGMELDDAPLPLPWNGFHAHRLLQVYFACPAAFHFVSQAGLSSALAGIGVDTVEIVFLLTRHPGSLIAEVCQSHFALFCTPAENLYRKRLDRTDVFPAMTECHLSADRQRPLDYEVHSVVDVLGTWTTATTGAGVETGTPPDSPRNAPVEFRPLFETTAVDDGNHGRYYTLRREPRLTAGATKSERRPGAYRGSEVFISLVDQRDAPHPDDMNHLSITALVTNRDLARCIPCDERQALTAALSLPIDGIGVVGMPSAPREALADGMLAWSLVRMLSAQLAPRFDDGEAEGARALRDTLMSFTADACPAQRTQVMGLVGASCRQVTGRLPGAGLLTYGRGLSFELVVDESRFSGISPFLLAAVLERLLAASVGINVFSQTSLASVQRGLIHQWPVRFHACGAA